MYCVMCHHAMTIAPSRFIMTANQNLLAAKPFCQSVARTTKPASLWAYRNHCDSYLFVPKTIEYLCAAVRKRVYIGDEN